MDWRISFIALIAGYIAGSISFTRLITRAIKHDKESAPLEVPVEGTEMTYKVTAFGATRASMELGPKAGCAIGMADMLKVALVVLIFKLLYTDQPYLLFAAIGGMTGHNWPVFYHFKGGRGISAYYGGLFIIDWLGAIVTMVTGLVFGMFIIKDYFVAYMAGLWFLIPWLWLTASSPYYIIYAVIVNILYVIAMLPDIKQYAAIKKVKKVDPKMVLETNPMGRGMLKISDWVNNLFKRK